MDRTSEYQGLLKCLQGEGIVPTEPPVKYLSPNSTDFSSAASAISDQLTETKRHIVTIERLVDQRSTFYNDPGAEIDKVSMLFHSDDQGLEKQLQLLLSWLERHTPIRSQRRKHGEEVVSALKARRAESVMAFQAALKTRTEVLKSKVRRQSQFGSGSVRRRELKLGTPLFTLDKAAAAPPLPLANGLAGPGRQEHAVPRTATTSMTNPPQSNFQAVPATSGGVRRRARAGGQMMTQLLMEEEESDQGHGVEHAQKRLSSARGLEREIEKLGEVFGRFSSLLVDQGETLRIMDTDVEAAAIEVEEGQKHLAKAYTITKGNRGVIIKIFATILVLAVILVTT